MSAGAPSWRGLDAAAREREYSPSSCIGGNYQPFIDDYVQRSAAARAALAGRLHLAYGAGARQRLDLFVPAVAAAAAPAAPGAVAAVPAVESGAAQGRAPPLLVFIHGGYWQELSKEESAFAAIDAVRQGIAFAALDYTLAPAATVGDMVAECRQALAWLHGRAEELGFDAARVVVAGSSAGAHLAAMCALPGPGESVVKAAILVSGIFDLEPLVGTSINQALGLDAALARALSPALADLMGFPPAIVCWGAIETAEFKRQGREFAALVQRAGTPCQVFEVPGRNHFDVVLDLADPATALGVATVDLLRSF